MSPYPMPQRYSVLTMEQEARAQAVRDHLPMAVYVLLVVMVCVLSFNLVTERHKTIKLMECIEGVSSSCPE